MKKPAYCIIILFLTMLSSCRQKKLTEQEEIAYWKSAFIDSSLQLLYKHKDTTAALHYFDSAASKAHQITVYPKAARFDIQAEYFYFFTKNDTSTAKFIDSSLALYQTPQLQNAYPRSYVSMLLFGGQIAYRLKQYTKANDYFFRAKLLGSTHLNACEQSAFAYNIAMVLYRQQNFAASLNYFRQAYQLRSTCAPQSFEVVLQQQEIQSNMGLCYLELKEYDSAMMQFDAALSIANKYKDTLGPRFMDRIYGVVYGNKVRVLIEQKRLMAAHELAVRAIALNDRVGYEQDFAQGVKLSLAEIYRQENNLDSMYAVLSGVKTYMEHADEVNRVQFQRLMAAYYEQTAQPQRAIQHLKAYFSLKESINQHQKLLTAADVNRQLRQKQQQLQIVKLTSEKKTAFTGLWITIIFLVMMVAIIYLVYYSYRRSKKNLKAMQALNQEVERQKANNEIAARQQHKAITEAVIRAQETERSVIGLELHDNINQVLTTVKLHNEMLMEGIGDPKTILPRTVQYLQDCINEIRGLSRRLSAPTLGKMSLEESVKELIDSVNATSKVKIIHQITGLENTVLKQELHLGIYRILQEQLNNILKHANASEVFISLEQQNDRLHLLVADNGEGFVLSNKNTGIGLVNMQTRAESLNGTFDLQSRPGHGCKITVMLPCLQ